MCSETERSRALDTGAAGFDPFLRNSVDRMIANIHDAVAMEVRSTTTGEPFTTARKLTEGTGISAFSVIHEELAPNRRASSPHAHTKLDEMYIVLSGNPTVHINSQSRCLSPGDFVVFRPQNGGLHWIANESSDVVALLRVASCPGDDVVVYADDAHLHRQRNL